MNAGFPRVFMSATAAARLSGRPCPQPAGGVVHAFHAAAGTEGDHRRPAGQRLKIDGGKIVLQRGFTSISAARCTERPALPRCRTGRSRSPRPAERPAAFHPRPQASGDIRRQGGSAAPRDTAVLARLPDSGDPSRRQSLRDSKPPPHSAGLFRRAKRRQVDPVRVTRTG